MRSPGNASNLQTAESPNVVDGGGSAVGKVKLVELPTCQQLIVQHEMLQERSRSLAASLLMLTHTFATGSTTRCYGIPRQPGPEVAVSNRLPPVEGLALTSHRVDGTWLAVLACRR